MKKNYFLIGSVAGLLLALLVSYLIMGPYFVRMFGEDSKYHSVPPILIGVIATLAAGAILDRRKMKKSFLHSALILPTGIFFFGSLVGCFANFVINGNLEDFQSWFFRPMFWLLIVGLPFALALGAIYFLVVQQRSRS